MAAFALGACHLEMSGIHRFQMGDDFRLTLVIENFHPVVPEA